MSSWQMFAGLPPGAGDSATFVGATGATNWSEGSGAATGAPGVGVTL
jgi:hypothetical protein